MVGTLILLVQDMEDASFDIRMQRVLVYDMSFGKVYLDDT